MEKTLKIQVTDKHIQDGRACVLWISEQNKHCPIALALYEQVMERSYEVIDRGEPWPNKKTPRFCNKVFPNGGASNPFSVANTLQISSEAIEKIFDMKGFYAPREMKLPKIVSEFIVKFDKGEKVEPFSFELVINY